MGRNFIGPEELSKISSFLNIQNHIPASLIPAIPFDENQLRKIKNDYILILGAEADKSGRKLTINSMRLLFGIDPAKAEPCFYNQDWYIKERFTEKSLAREWYLVGKKVIPGSRGLAPEKIKLKNKEKLPSAVLTAFTFFSCYFLNKEMLWKNDFIWCADKDYNGDRIYTGRYIDPNGINKNGFNIHRYLNIRSAFGAVSEISK